MPCSDLKTRLIPQKQVVPVLGQGNLVTAKYEWLTLHIIRWTLMRRVGLGNSRMRVSTFLKVGASHNSEKIG